VMCGSRKNQETGNAFPCGKCIPCLVNRRRKWVTRLQLEFLAGGARGAFITLTYDASHLPERGTLVPRDLQDFLRELRRQLDNPGPGSPLLRLFGRRVRYYAVGEYGDRYERPHYHVCLFGLDFLTSHEKKALERIWGKGFVHVGNITAASITYVAGYHFKKLDRERDDGKTYTEWLEGREPEFARMSRRPGIGKGSAEKVAQAYMRSESSRSALVRRGAPREVRLNGEMWPLDRFMREAIVGFSGMEFSGVKQHAQALTVAMEKPQLSVEERKLKAQDAARKGRALKQRKRMKGRL